MAEYLRFRDAAQALRVLEDVQKQIFTRPPDVPEPSGEVLLDGVSLDDLFAAFAQVLRRTQEAPQELPGEEFTVGQKMDTIVAALRRAGGGAAFWTLFRGSASRLEIIVTFLALLELIKLRRIRARQQEAFGEIEIVLAVTA
jgi:segregation and condensation protein A